MVILRIENGSIPDLVDEFLIQFGNRLFPAGGVILIGSPAHLANVGLSAYVSDLMEAIDKLKSRLGKETRVRHLPLLLLTGTEDRHLIRDLINLAAWIKQYFGYDDYHVEETHAEALQVILDSAEGRNVYQDKIRYRLPDNNRAGHTIFCSSATSYYPAKIKLATTAQEKKVISSLIQELRTKMALDLDANPSLDRGLALQAGHRKSVDFLIVGSSNANRLTTALSEMGYSVGISHKANFRIYRGSTDTLLTQTQEASRTWTQAPSSTS
jgi:hypothetical protein